MNRRTGLLVIGLFLLGTGSIAAQEKVPVYESESGRFKVKFPGTPKIDTKDLATGRAGTPPIPVVTEKVETSQGAILAVVYADYPEAFKNVLPKKLTDAVRDGLKGKDGKVVIDQTLISATKPELRHLRIEAGKNVIRVHAMMVGQRLYQVMVTGDAKSVDKPACTEFLESFEIIR